jgi:hypothetical protein
MKKSILIMLIIIIAIVSVGFVSHNSCMPPSFPSSFYGTVKGLKVGENVNVWINGAKVMTTDVFKYNNSFVYALNIPAKDICNNIIGGTEGDKIIFKSHNKIIGSGIWHSGTNQNVNLVYRK